MRTNSSVPAPSCLNEPTKDTSRGCFWDLKNGERDCIKWGTISSESTCEHAHEEPSDARKNKMQHVVASMDPMKSGVFGVALCSTAHSPWRRQTHPFSTEMAPLLLNKAVRSRTPGSLRRVGYGAVKGIFLWGFGVVPFKRRIFPSSIDHSRPPS